MWCNVIGFVPVNQHMLVVGFAIVVPTMSFVNHVPDIDRYKSNHNHSHITTLILSSTSHILNKQYALTPIRTMIREKQKKQRAKQTRQIEMDQSNLNVKHGVHITSWWSCCFHSWARVRNLKKTNTFDGKTCYTCISTIPDMVEDEFAWWLMKDCAKLNPLRNCKETTMWSTIRFELYVNVMVTLRSCYSDEGRQLLCTRKLRGSFFH